MTYTDEQRQFLDEHLWAVLATARRDGSPQQSMVGYVGAEDGSLVMSVKDYTAKWKNAIRQPLVSLTVVDGRRHLVVYGTVEAIADDPLRAELTADVFARLSGNERPDPTSIVPTLDEQKRTVLRLRPERVALYG